MGGTAAVAIVSAISTAASVSESENKRREAKQLQNVQEKRQGYAENSAKRQELNKQKMLSAQKQRDFARQRQQGLAAQGRQSTLATGPQGITGGTGGLATGGGKTLLGT